MRVAITVVDEVTLIVWETGRALGRDDDVRLTVTRHLRSRPERWGWWLRSPHLALAAGEASVAFERVERAVSILQNEDEKGRRGCLPDALAVLGALADHAPWAGSTTPSGTPTATLWAPNPGSTHVLALLMVRLADLNDDGVLDVVAPTSNATINGQNNAGAMFVWAGGTSLTGAPAPTATLIAPDPEALEDLGVYVEFGDVTGDGRVDAVTLASTDVGGVDTGSAYVWAGSTTLAGATTPSAVLRVPGAVAGDSLEGQLHLADVSGDGALDVIMVSPRADIAGVIDAGAAYVWVGGSGLSGALAPNATLRVAGAVTDDRLGGNAAFSSILSASRIAFVEVSGDGIVDVVVPAPRADDGGASDAGAIYVWRGGPTLTGTLSPWSTLRGASSFARLTGDLGSDYLVSELTGDATLDIVALGDVAYVWDGGAALAGSPAPLATLTGIVNGVFLASLQVGDVDDDGQDDVVVSSSLDSSVAPASGAILVWLGGATLTGPLTADLTLTNPSAVDSDQLHAWYLTDVTGDGVLDVIGSTEFADLGGAMDAGATYVWFGGPAILTATGPDATLTEPTPANSNAFGRVLYTADVTADGVQDIVSVCSNADPGGVADAGAIYVWSGATLGAAVTPTATLVASVPTAADRLGLIDMSPHTSGVLFGDVTGDGATDLVVAASFADLGAATDAGCVYVFTSGVGLAGATPPTATLSSPSPGMGDRLPIANTLFNPSVNQPLLLADVTDDGVLDVIANSSRADPGGVTDAGAVFLWQGGATLVGAPAPTTWMIPGAIAGDGLGQVAE